MEKGLLQINNEIVYASLLGKTNKTIEEEKKYFFVKNESNNNRLICVECGSPIIHKAGSIRIPYFSHKKGQACPYSQYYEKLHENVKICRSILSALFSDRGFSFKTDCKIKNKYLHFLIELKNNQRIAIQIVRESSTDTDEMRYLDSLCKEENIELKWLVIGSLVTSIIHTSPIKSYILNHSKNRDLIVVSKNDLEKAYSSNDATLEKKITVSQFKRYEHPNYNFGNSTEPFCLTKNLTDLILIDGELSFSDFPTEYEKNLNEKLESIKRRNILDQQAREKSRERKKLIDPLSVLEKEDAFSKKNVSDKKIPPSTFKPNFSLTLSDRFLLAKRSLFERAYHDLNPDQQQAVFHVNGPLLVLAGAGSGKTTVLVRRIGFLIRYGNAYHSDRIPEGLTEGRVRELERAAEVLTPADILPILDEFAEDPCPPWRVLAITFTNKAANEIKARLCAMFPDDPASAEDIWAGTFHRTCMRILRRYGEHVGYRPDFSVYDVDDSKRALAEALRRVGESDKTLPIKSVASIISRAKDRLVTPEEFPLEFESELRRNGKFQAISKVYEQYQMILREANALDFDDIIMQTVLLLRRRPDVAKFYQDRFRYVCVDEYQDTNPAQFALTRLLAADPRQNDPTVPTGKENVMVVGDDDQSIYKFRGATIENILTFHKLYKNATVIRLEQNYRSTQNILDAANAVISHNTGRMGKTLWTAQGAGACIRMILCDDHNAEARRIVDEIQKKVARREANYRDFAILYRMNAQSQSIEKAFARAAIPYRMLGGLRFTDRKEIRDAVAYLQLIVNPYDSVRMRRIINEPRRKIGDKTLESVSILASEQNCSEFEIIERADEFLALKNARAQLLDFAKLIHTLTADAQKMTLDVLFDAVLDRSGYRKMLVDAGEAEADRLQNLEEFKSQIIDYIKQSEEPTLGGFLEETALVAEVDRYDEEADAVVMMTVHSAKGLEFPVVFLPGMEDGIFPGSQSVEAGASELEEERRLAYVAITRAKRELFILHTNNRLLFGRTCYNPLSRFASEIPSNLIDREKPSQSGGYGGFGGGAYGGRIGSPYGSRGAQAPASRPRVYFSEQDQPATPSVPVKKQPPRSGNETFRAGDRVRHITFGVGEIISVKPMGTDTLYEIVFDSVGTKKLMATYARLKKE